MSKNFLDRFSDLSVNMNGVRIPKIELRDEDYLSLNIDKDQSSLSVLKSLCKIGMDNRLRSGQILEKDLEIYRQRFKIELDVIVEGEFVDYFILLWDIIRFTREKEISKGASRGSAGGCLIFFILGITDIDPIKYGLYFERFLSRARIKKNVVDGITYLEGSCLPDCDLDISHSGRETVVNYFLNKYAGQSCKLSTMSTLTTKILIKECGKIVAEYPEQKMNEISSHIPSLFGKVLSIDDSVKDNDTFKTFCDENPKVINIARKLSGLIKNKGSHASGYLISYDQLADCMPVELGSNGEIVSSYDMRDAQELAVKVDLLGLQDVTLISNVCKRVGIKMEDIDPSDKFIYDALKNIETPYGLFQIGADCNFRVMKQVRPDNIYDLSAVLALARPGALQFADDYAKFVNEGIVPEFDIESDILKKILAETGGVILYQETLMRIASEVFELTLLDADNIRRAVGKKDKEKMKKYEDVIKTQGDKLNIPKSAAFYWKTLLSSADYSFNFSHSASYSILAAQSVYLKFKYPLDFFLESLKLAKDKQDISAEINLIQSELKYFNISLLQPDLVKSDLDFKKENDNLRFGLSAIKGISDKSLERLKEFLSFDKVNKFEVFNAAQSVRLNIGILSALIQAGTLNSIAEDRPRLVYEAQLYNLLTPREKLWCMEHGSKYGYSLFNIMLDSENIADKTGKPVFKETRLATLKTRAEKYREIYKINSKSKELCDYVYESRLLGFSYSQKLSKLMSKYSNNDLRSLFNARFSEPDDKFAITGEVKLIEEKTSKKGKSYAKITVSDESDTIDILVFEPRLSGIKDRNTLPKEGDIIIADVSKWNDTITVSDIKINTDKVYLKLSELKVDD